jgi:adenine deaminase
MTNRISGNIVDIHHRTQYFGHVLVEGSVVKSLEQEGPVKADASWILPGFIDAHIHIESSMLVPSEFARLAVVHGTVATVSDPHEIANVLGIEGVRYMIDNGSQVNFRFYFGAPSCVPATVFETAGAAINAAAIADLLQDPAIYYLSEMMNYPGVLHKDLEVMAKIAAAHAAGKPIDGHAPGLRGEDSTAYFDAGISTDHECYTYEEGLEKLELGVNVIIREGSAARNFEALIPLIAEYPDQIMFCSDDKHPDELIHGHINTLVARAVAQGYDLYDVLRAASLNPVRHYGLDTGLLRVGDSADFVIVEDLRRFRVEATYIRGEQVSKGHESCIPRVEAAIINRFEAKATSPGDFSIPVRGKRIRYIEAVDGALVTGEGYISDDNPSTLAGQDILKIAVVNRYQEAKPAVAYIRGFGLSRGAIASCVGHDSHNIIAVGVTDEAISKAVNAIIAQRGGIAAVDEQEEHVLPLPVAGIMTNADGYETASRYRAIDAWVKSALMSSLSAPFMTLSFMALLVIPQLKLSDQGLFDGKNFRFVSLFED